MCALAAGSKSDWPVSSGCNNMLTCMPDDRLFVCIECVLSPQNVFSYYNMCLRMLICMPDDRLFMCMECVLSL